MRLFAADNVARVTFGADASTYLRLIFTSATAVMECSLLEDTSSLEESMSFEGGAVAVRHTLTLVADRNLAAAWLGPEFRNESLLKGLCAVVTLNDGRQLLVGYSERFGAQQPLRIKEIISSSGQRPSEAPTITMILENYDTSVAALYAGD